MAIQCTTYITRSWPQFSVDPCEPWWPLGLEGAPCFLSDDPSVSVIISQSVGGGARAVRIDWARAEYHAVHLDI